ncbi:[Acyl-carrier-protein] S-malonyltransferase [Maricaulis maris MCS10]|uniref:Malonyl CoA-acyl carrier protein transacylase n=1 Tax=Maricaulis maris (strain MCS10) TaxID=394221 RepID=Q0AQD1_MARMM|nr:ACP S-malonyltransferase [Maricaulis maris]ABI65506.1 [Acyl-carrier-protein] S-malonyltransferase [Maricaulis maris MCS10]
MKFAFVFPGQGSQSVGMAQELAGEFASARAVLDEIDTALDQNLSGLMADGPIETLTLTENAQPALMASSLAVMAVLKAEFDVDVNAAEFVAGHSLGEYSALAAAGALSITDAAKLLKLRGLAMQKAVPVGEGTMAALLGADEDLAAAAVAAGATAGVCAIANDNAPGQIVISGSTAAIDAAIAKAAELGLKKAMKLPVSAPFHCPMMQAAADAMAEALAAATIKAPSVPVVANVTARPTSDVETIRKQLVEQVTGRVRWRESVLWMVEEAGITTLAEAGSGKVLSTMLKRTTKDATGVPLNAAAGLEAFAASLKE